MKANILHEAISAVCPIVGVVVGKDNDRSTWKFTPRAAATSEQIAAANNVIATIPIEEKNVVTFAGFISRWTNAEYAALMQARAAAVANGNVGMVKQWDMAFANGSLDLNMAGVQVFKNNLVSAGILTQARADVIFS